MKVHFAIDGDNKYSATKEYSKNIYMVDYVSLKRYLILNAERN